MSGELRYRAAAGVGGAVLGALLSTARFEVHGAEHYRQFTDSGQPVLFALWHGRLLPLAYHHRHQRLVTLVSRSSDGEYIARLLDRWGFEAVRGSSSRGGGEALRSMMRLARRGRSLTITPDGPRGPRQRMKPGAIVAAQMTGLPIIPAAAGADRGWWFDSWDRFLLPKPFARIRVAYGEPHPIPRDASPEEIEQRMLEVERALDRITAWVDGDGGPD